MRGGQVSGRLRERKGGMEMTWLGRVMHDKGLLELVHGG